MSFSQVFDRRNPTVPSRMTKAESRFQGKCEVQNGALHEINRNEKESGSPILFRLFKQIFQLFRKAGFARKVGVVTAFFKLTEQILLLGGKVAGNFYLNGEIKVAASSRARRLHASALEGELGACLSAFGELIVFLALQSGGLDRAAQCRFREG